MTKIKDREQLAAMKALLGKDADFLRPLVQTVVQELLEAEMNETLGAGKSERTVERLGYRCGYYSRTLATRVGKLELGVPQARIARMGRAVFDGAVRTLSAQREGFGVGAGGDVCARRVDPEGRGA